MLSRARREEGAAAVEFALVLPILMVLMFFVAPIVYSGYQYMVLQRAVAHGVRYASRVDVNPRYAADGSLTRRPSPAEVKQFVVSAATPLTVPTASIDVTPNPRTSLPGQEIQVSASYEMNYGVMADIANGLKDAFFGGGELLPGWTVTVSARGREE